MSRATLAVVCDQLRTLGLEDVARWVEHPDAVRRLLALEPYTAHDDSCTSCGEQPQDSHTHLCRIAAAWRALGDPRGAADIERAYEEAWRENVGRADFQLPRTVTHGEWGPVNGANRGDLVEVTLGRDGMRMTGVVERAPHPLHEHVLGNVSALATSPAGLTATVGNARWPIEGDVRVGDAVMFNGMTGRVRRVETRDGRISSDARGMEAVEDEARRHGDAMARNLRILARK